MSFNQLYQDVEKSWCDVRINNLKYDGQLINANDSSAFSYQELSGNITFNGPWATNQTTTYNATIIGNVCNLRINDLVSASSSAVQITSTDFPASLIPTGTSQRAAGTNIIVENATNQEVGGWAINDSNAPFSAANQLAIKVVNPANSQLVNFSAGGNSGFRTALNLTYHLDQ